MPVYSYRFDSLNEAADSLEICCRRVVGAYPPGMYERFKAPRCLVRNQLDDPFAKHDGDVPRLDFPGTPFYARSISNPTKLVIFYFNSVLNSSHSSSAVLPVISLNTGMGSLPRRMWWSSVGTSRRSYFCSM